MKYASVVGETAAEKVIERSRFLSFVCHTEGEEEARAFLGRVRAAHPLATHVCFGSVADKAGNLQRFSDDGEPQGTAGMPILGVLKAKNLRETTLAVVRYFGGVKLGAGGLTRAYAGCAAECVQAAPCRMYEMCAEILLEVDYASVSAALRFLEGEEVLSRSFGEGASFLVAVRESEEAEFSARARDFFNGKVRLTAGNRYFYPFSGREPL